MDANAKTAPKYSLTHRRAVLVVVGVVLPIFLASLDQTIIAGALPSVGRELNGTQGLSWLVTGYLIAVAATTSLYGKLADIYGRRIVLTSALALSQVSFAVKAPP